MFSTSSKRLTQKGPSDKEERRKRRDEAIRRIAATNEQTLARLEQLERAEKQNRAFVQAAEKLKPSEVTVPVHNCKVTFESLVQIMGTELVQDPDTVYTAKSVVELTKSMYHWMCVDKNATISLPLEPGDGEPSFMYPEGSVVSRTRNTPELEELARAMALDCEITPSTAADVSAVVSGGRRATRSNASLSSMDQGEKDSRMREFGTDAYHGRRRPVIPVSQYPAGTNRPYDFYGTTGYPPAQPRGARRDSLVRPGTTINSVYERAPEPEHDHLQQEDDISYIASPALQPRHAPPPNVRVVPRQATVNKVRYRDRHVQSVEERDDSGDERIA